jgi:hypothetical protein
MTRLLVATDHRFFSKDSRVYDTCGLGEHFFDDYLEAFDQVGVICRMKNVEVLPTGAFECDQERLSFIGIRDLLDGCFKPQV